MDDDDLFETKQPPIPSSNSNQQNLRLPAPEEPSHIVSWSNTSFRQEQEQHLETEGKVRCGMWPTLPVPETNLKVGQLMTTLREKPQRY